MSPAALDDAHGDRGDRLPVLLVHGIRTSSTMWRAQVEALHAAGAAVLAVDLPGHGTRLGEPFTVAAARAVITGGVEQLGGRVLLVGLSLGGLLAVDYAARHPDQVGGLVAAACSTSPQVRLRAGWAEISRWIEATPGSGAQLNAFVVRTFLTPQAALDIGAGGFALTVMSQALRAVAGLDPEADLATVGCPVWVVNGRFDHFRSQEGRMLRAARSSGQPVHHVVVPHARHLVSLDAPVAFTRVLLEALDATAAGRAGHGAGQGSGQQVPGPRPTDQSR
ncbi:Pimeloyl-ACP methyl ester carboxylesterase [Sanguibacter gelidistatuariae]|uniref:Pimeloyl-ACP methyl ester carboxylesterase n=1 Tax=Sanguibacter gelidistatuariae TaxID=1814289 RepID=A0A1G6KER8_9MICO|nr:alpha/beta hydrolase [Sanguibacter gelidistatuariae]SDC29348.1 Pimeloyl-ACP methyl ester carboxylesterase [Sanguibacter gelidistatuariae]